MREIFKPIAIEKNPLFLEELRAYLLEGMIQMFSCEK